MCVCVRMFLSVLCSICLMVVSEILILSSKIQAKENRNANPIPDHKIFPFSVFVCIRTSVCSGTLHLSVDACMSEYWHSHILIYTQIVHPE